MMYSYIQALEDRISSLEGSMREPSETSSAHGEDSPPRKRVRAQSQPMPETPTSAKRVKHEEQTLAQLLESTSIWLPADSPASLVPSAPVVDSVRFEAIQRTFGILPMAPHSEAMTRALSCRGRADFASLIGSLFICDINEPRRDSIDEAYTLVLAYIDGWTRGAPSGELLELATKSASRIENEAARSRVKSDVSMLQIWCVAFLQLDRAQFR